MLAHAQRFDTGNEILLAYSRGGLVEAVHRGSIAIVDSTGRSLYSFGNINIPITIRSCIKPFQLITVLQSEAEKKFGFTGEELALAASSHSGEEIHIRAAESMLARMNLDESDLRCGLHPPINIQMAMEMAEKGIKPSPITNNCSGKHASMLAACLVNGWDISNYEELEHPLQQQNQENTSAFAGIEPPLPVAIDGCTVPTFAIPLYNCAMAYARLADSAHAPRGLEDYAARVFSIMNEHPDYGSGSKNRLESRLMKDFPGRLVAKVGAEACYAIGLAPGVISEKGVGIALKIEEGLSFNRAVDAVAVSVLNQLGLVDQGLWEKNYQQYLPSVIRDNRKNAIGNVEVLFDVTL